MVDPSVGTEPVVQCGPDLPTIYSPPSMFGVADDGAVSGALYPLAPAGFVKLDQPGGLGYTSVTLRWNEPLTITSVPGSWELSVLVTVAIARSGQQDELRVFYFDPESEVGNGTTPPEAGA